MFVQNNDLKPRHTSSKRVDVTDVFLRRYHGGRTLVVLPLAYSTWFGDGGKDIRLDELFDTGGEWRYGCRQRRRAAHAIFYSKPPRSSSLARCEPRLACADCVVICGQSVNNKKPPI